MGRDDVLRSAIIKVDVRLTKMPPEQCHALEIGMRMPPDRRCVCDVTE
jgi:hypothetical protein